MAKKKASAKSSTPNRGEVSETSASSEEPSADFEESLAEIEKIVLQLEGGELTLAESLEKYESAVGRLKQCHQLLDAAERRVTVLAGFDAEGNPVTEPLEELESFSGGETGRQESPRAGRRGVKKAPASDAEGAGGDPAAERGRVDGSQDLF